MKKMFLPALEAASMLILFNFANLPSFAETLRGNQLEDKQSAKNANIEEAEKLNSQSNHEFVPTEAKQSAEETAKVVNKVPGVKVDAKDLEPTELPPIKGFHPIKRLLRPVENLEGMSIKLEQQIMKLEGPIASLQPPMVNLQKKMTGVDQDLSHVNNTLGQMQDRLQSVQGEVKGARGDIETVRQEIVSLKEPIEQLRGPLSGVAKPLEALQAQLNMILMAIVITAIVVAIGTPLVALQIYRNRHKIFPEMHDRELTPSR